MHPKDTDVMAKSVDPDQTALEGSGSILFAQTWLSVNLDHYGIILWLLSWPTVLF